MNTQTKVAFPSLQWFEALQALMNGNEEQYKALGYADSRAVFKVGDRAYGLVFEIYSCTEARELDADEFEAYDPDWILEGDLDTWREMIENIKTNGRADSDHTLNRLSLLRHPFRIYGADQTRVDQFHRQALSFQEFVDASVALETNF